MKGCEVFRVDRYLGQLVSDFGGQGKKIAKRPRPKVEKAGKHNCHLVTFLDHATRKMIFVDHSVSDKPTTQPSEDSPVESRCLACAANLPAWGKKEEVFSAKSVQGSLEHDQINPRVVGVGGARGRTEVLTGLADDELPA
jgi:hypothetical protein